MRSGSPRSTLPSLKTSSLLLCLGGCISSPHDLDDDSCDPRALSSGEVRVRRLPCSDEFPAGGDARRSDWILENAWVRFVIRDTPSALTRLHIAGGTVVDAVSTGSGDVLLEAVPLVNGGWFVDAEAVAVEEASAVRLDIVGRFADGQEGSVQYRLGAQSQHLEITGADGLSITPVAGSEWYGSTLDNGDDLLGVLGSTGHSDLGGWVETTGVDGLIPGDRSTVYAHLFSDQQAVQRSAEGEYILVLDEALQPVARLVPKDGYIDSWVPSEAMWLQAMQAGALPGERVALDAPEPLVAPPSGHLQVRAIDGPGHRIAVTALWQGMQFVSLPEDTTGMPFPPGTGDVTWFAGPGHELHTQRISVPEEGIAHTTVDAPWVVTPGVLAALAVPSSPDQHIRTDSTAVLTALAGAGVRYAVLVANDEVSAAQTTALEPTVHAITGSHSRGPGTPMAWPWSANRNHAAHGAVDWFPHSAEDLLAIMSRRDNRILMITPSWLDAVTTPPAQWLPPPDLLQVSGLADLDAVVTAHDHGIPLSLVGPLTWVDGVDPFSDFDAVDVETGLLLGKTTATNGPRLSMDVHGVGIGGVVPVQSPVRITAKVEAPTWMPLHHAALIGPGGEELQRWDLDSTDAALRLEETIELALAPDWVVLATWGEEDNPPWLEQPAWALSSAVWLTRP